MSGVASRAAAAGESTPLLPEGVAEGTKRRLRENCPSFFEFKDTWSAEQDKGTLEPWGFAVSLVAETFPRGFLPLAAGLTAVGIPYTLLLGTVIFAGAMFSMWAVGVVAETSGETTWKGQWAKLIGPRTVCLPLLVVAATTFMCCVCMLAVAAELAGSLGILPFGERCCLVVLALVLLRLVTTKRSIADLEIVSTVAAGAVVLTVLIVLWRACDGSYVDGGVYDDGIYGSSARFKNGPFDIVPRMESLVLVSLLCNSFLFHHNGCKLYRELERASADEHWTCVWYASCAMIFGYFLTMAAGVFSFGTQAQTILLDNYSSQDFLGGVARLAMAVSLICGMPLSFSALREATSDLLSEASVNTKERLVFVSAQNVLAAVLVLAVTVGAWFANNPYQVVGLTACILGAFCSFILPCVLLWAVQHNSQSQPSEEEMVQGKSVLAVLCLGAVVLVAGLVAPVALRHYFFAEYETGPTFRQEMTNLLDMQYYGMLTVGQQDLKAILDTGSTEFVVISDKCGGKCGGTSKFYHSRESTTYKSGALQLMLSYGSGQVLGQEAYDTVKLGELHASDMAFWEGVDADMTELLSSSDFQAIVGLGPVAPDMRLFRPGAAGNAKAWAALLPAIGVRKFSVCFGREVGSSGYIIWNDDAKSKNPGIFSKVTIPPSGYWLARLTDVRLGDKRVLCGFQGCGAILDSGTSLIALPREQIEAMRGAINALGSDCTNMGNLPTLTFKLDGVPISLTADAYLGDFDSDLKEQRSSRDLNLNTTAPTGCQPALIEAGLYTSFGPTWILGMPFFRHYYTMFVRGAKFTPASVYLAHASSDCELTKGDGNQSTLREKGTARRISWKHVKRSPVARKINGRKQPAGPRASTQASFKAQKSDGVEKATSASHAPLPAWARVTEAAAASSPLAEEASEPAEGSLARDDRALPARLRG